MSPELGNRTNHCRALLARGREIELEGKYFSLEELTTCFPKDKTTANEENKQFDPEGRKERSHHLEKRVYWYYFLPRGNSGRGCQLLVSCAFVFACLSVVYCSYQVIIFLRAEENIERRKSMMNATGGQAPSCPSTP